MYLSIKKFEYILQVYIIYFINRIFCFFVNIVINNFVPNCKKLYAIIKIICNHSRLIRSVDCYIHNSIV